MKAATYFLNGSAGSLVPASQVVAPEAGEPAEIVELEDAGAPEVVASQPVEFVPKYSSDIPELYLSY